MRPPLTLPNKFAIKVLTGYDLPLGSVRSILDNPRTIHLKGGRETLSILDAGNGRVTIQ
jgi:hypothetical protein